MAHLCIKSVRWVGGSLGVTSGWWVFSRGCAGGGGGRRERAVGALSLACRWSVTGVRRVRAAGVLTIVSTFVENDCHERTTTPHIRVRRAGGHRPRSRGPLGLLGFGIGRRQGRGEARRGGVVLSAPVPGRGDRRVACERDESDAARSGAARPGDQRAADRAAAGGGRRPLSEEPASKPSTTRSPSPRWARRSTRRR